MTKANPPMLVRGRFLALGAVVALLIGAGAALAQSSASYNLGWNVLSGGGGRTASASYTVEGSIGQAVVGPVTSSSYQALSGFWQSFAPTLRAFIPVAYKAHPSGW